MAETARTWAQARWAVGGHFLVLRDRGSSLTCHSHLLQSAIRALQTWGKSHRPKKLVTLPEPVSAKIKLQTGERGKEPGNWDTEDARSCTGYSHSGEDALLVPCICSQREEGILDGG